MASDAENAFLVNSYTAGNMFGPNPYSKYQGSLSMPGYQGAATDARGSGIGPTMQNQPTDYLGLMQNPGHVTTPGAQPQTGDQPMSVLDHFLNSTQGGTGAGGMYSNKPFFDTLNAMKASPGGTSSGGIGAIAPPVYAAPAPPSMWTPPAPVPPPATAPAPAPAAPPGSTLNSVFTNALSSLTPQQDMFTALMNQGNGLSPYDRSVLGTKLQQSDAQKQAQNIAYLMNMGGGANGAMRGLY